MSDATVGMTICVEGVLGRAADRCRRSRDFKYLAWPLEKLTADLNEVWERRDEPGILAEFFSVWNVAAMNAERAEATR